MSAPSPDSVMPHPRTRAAVTFDMEHASRPHQDPSAPSSILDTLVEHGVAATFFVQGRWARAFPDLARRAADEGHLIGNHSHHHGRMSQLTDDGIRYDVTAAHRALVEITGAAVSPWFRCPFGDGHDDPRVLARLADLGYRNVHWHIDSLDYLETTRPEPFAGGLVDQVVAHGDGAVILFHSWPGITARQLGPTLDKLAKADVDLVTVDQL